MANKASHQVHELISSLTPAEKRYFKLYADRHSSSSKNNYSKLFDAIDAQQEYDEKELLESFKGKPFLKHFSIAKNRLYHKILQSLNAFHAESSVEAELRRYLHYVEILYHKTLYNQCSRILATAEKIAAKNQKTIIHLSILQWKKKLVEVNNYEENDDSIIGLENELIKQLRVGNELWKTKSAIFEQLFSIGQAREKEVIEVTEEALAKIKQLKSNSGLFQNQYLIHHTESAFHFQKGDYKSCKEALIDNRELIENNLYLVKQEPILYHSVLMNLVFVSAKQNEFSDVEKYLEESRLLPSKLKINPSSHIQHRIYSDGYALELAISNLKGDSAKGGQLVNVLPEKLKEWSGMLSDAKKASFMHGMSVMFFILGSTVDALKWNNELLNTISINKSEDSFCYGLILHAILHYEMNNYEILPSVLKSLKRYLEIRERRHRFEDHFLTLGKKLVKHGGLSRPRVDFEEFIGEITPLQNMPFEKIAFEYFDFIAWAKSHLEGGSYRTHLLQRCTSKNVL